MLIIFLDLTGMPSSVSFYIEWLVAQTAPESAQGLLKDSNNLMQDGVCGEPTEIYTRRGARQRCRPGPHRFAVENPNYSTILLAVRNKLNNIF